MRLNKSIVSLFLLVSLVGCNNNTSTSSQINNSSQLEQEDKITLRDTYTNKFDEQKIPGQWSEYGVGDPFVYRFNGKYYLYCSTKNFETGVRGWISDDLINWNKITGQGLDEGYVSMDSCTITAYAPEVIYHNGYFYMVQSQGGNGHYILRAEKPEGPFVAITGNFGESIDGSFFIDDDEQMYLLRASNSGIRIVKVNDDFTMGDSRTLVNTQLGGWTEGPYMLKVDGVSYLTYTGNNVVSDGYRIAYSYATGDVFDRNGYSEGGTIALNTSNEFRGLGHSSTVLGPNMDSYYIAYHNLNSSGGPDRSFNISRLNFDGPRMTINHPELEDNFVPDMPAFVANDKNGLSLEGDYLLSSIETENTFTAEFNFIGESTQGVFAYQDENNYVNFKIDNSDISLNKITNGISKEIATVKLNKEYDYTKLHTLRISYKDSNLDLYFDNIQKLINSNVDKLEGGKIGYLNNDATICYTAFSNFGQGSSLQEEVYQEKVLAANYYKSNFSKDSGLVNQTSTSDEYEFNGIEGSHDVKLAKKGDSVTYKIWVKEDGYYGLDFLLDKKYAGKKVILQIDNQAQLRCVVPQSGDIYTQYVKLTMGEVDITQGAHYLKVICDGEEFAFHEIETFKSSKTWPKFENDLSTYIDKGVVYVNSWKIRDNGHYALAGNRNLMYFGDETITDCTIEVDIELVGETQANSCGVILRAANPAFASSDNMASIQGYYCGFNNSKVFISKCDYNNSEIDTSADAYASSSNEIHHLKIEARSNKITVSLDNGAVNLEYFDSKRFSHGHLGLYTDGAAAIYRNVKIYH